MIELHPLWDWMFAMSYGEAVCWVTGTFLIGMAAALYMRSYERNNNGTSQK